MFDRWKALFSKPKPVPVRDESLTTKQLRDGLTARQRRERRVIAEVRRIETMLRSQGR